MNYSRSTHSTLKIALLSTPVGALGSGLGGGVELTLQNIAQELDRRGHRLQIIAPEGSFLANRLPIIQIPGALQPTAQTQERQEPIVIPVNSVLANMWAYAHQHQADYDLLINFAYDWLPFYLTGWFNRPIAHLVSMGSLTDAIDMVIEQTLARFPGTIGMHSQTQAATFSFSEHCRILSNGIDMSQYQFCAHPQQQLGWVGRIAPEKGISDAMIVAQQTGLPLKVWGAMPDPHYWQQICQHYPDAPVTYEGFLPTEQLQAALGKCQALLMTPKWVEAFGNVAIEALACGVPVIAYRRGGPAEIVQHGQTGWLVEPDDTAGLTTAITQINQIDRQHCRQYAETYYSMQAMGDRIEVWLEEIMAHQTNAPWF